MIAKRERRRSSLQVLEIQRAKKEKQQNKTFESMLKKVFNSYDTSKNGSLDPKQVRLFINELRCCLNLTCIDNTQFTRIITILDENGDGEIDVDEFWQFLPEVFPVLLEPGEEMNNLLNKVFR